MKPYALCIPNFNRSATIIECIDSVASQENDDFEIIIQDDCSTDDSLSKIRNRFGGRVKISKNDQNLGFAGNVSRCLGYSSDYEWVGILHSDDIHLNDSLSIFKKHFSAFPSAGVIYSKTHDIDANGRILREAKGELRSFPPGDAALIATGGCLPYSTVFYRRDAIKAVGLYDQRYRFSADEEFNARVLSKFQSVQTSEVLGCYRRHPGQTMIKSWQKDEFIKSYEEMKLKINSYLSPTSMQEEREVKAQVALTLFAHCSGLVANGRGDIVRKFHSHLIKTDPASLLRPSVLTRMVIQSTPLVGKIIARKLAKNAGLQ